MTSKRFEPFRAGNPGGQAKGGSRKPREVPATVEHVAEAYADRRCADCREIAMVHDKQAAVCKTCGREPRVAVLMHPDFPLDDCGCVECARKTGDTPQASAKERKPASPQPRSRPASTPARVPVAPESAQTAEPPTEDERSSEVTGREWESQRSRSRGSLTRGLIEREF
jgi:hypothetical protein